MFTIRHRYVESRKRRQAAKERERSVCCVVAPLPRAPTPQSFAAIVIHALTFAYPPPPRISLSLSLSFSLALHARVRAAQKSGKGLMADISPALLRPSADDHHWRTCDDRSLHGSASEEAMASAITSNVAARRTGAGPELRPRSMRRIGTSWARRTFQLSGWIEKARKARTLKEGRPPSSEKQDRLRECNDEGTLIAFHQGSDDERYV